MGLKLGRKPTFLILLALTQLSEVTYGHSTGAPATKEICGTMLPQHGVAAQTSQSPYTSSISNLSPMGGDSVKITLLAPAGENFKGFLVMVKRPGDTQKAHGKFKPDSSPDAQTISCFNTPQSAVTHVDGAEKSNITVEWIAPNDEDLSGLELVVTYVKTAGEIWQAIPHPQKLSVKRNLLATTPAPQRQISDSVRNKLKEQYSGCDKKGCLGLPDGCIDQYLSTQDNPEPATCKVFLTWSAAGEKNIYSLTGRPGTAADTRGYLAMGFSEDKAMGQDSVVGCFLNGGTPDVHRFYNRGKSNTKIDNPALGLGLPSKSFEDGYLFCTFEQTDHIVEGLDIKIRDNKYHLLLARGTGASEGQLNQHADVWERVASNNKISVFDVGVFGAKDTRILIQLHGAFMIVAWLVCASTGMFTARYYKLTHTDSMPFNKAFWFVLHLTCMFSTVFFTICGAVFIFVKNGAYIAKEGDEILWHPILGTILFGLALFQVLLAFCRPHPGTSKRPIFNWIHWTVGNSAHIVGIACIFLANELSAANLKEDKYMFVMMGAVLFHIVMHLVMSFHTLWADKQMDSKTKRAVVPGPMKPNGLSSEAPGTGFRTFMLALYFLGLLGCAAALIYFVCRSLTTEIVEE